MQKAMSLLSNPMTSGRQILGHQKAGQRNPSQLNSSQEDARNPGRWIPGGWNSGRRSGRQISGEGNSGQRRSTRWLQGPGLVCLLLVLGLSSIPSKVWADEDLLASMFTPGGFELYRDDRLTLLFAAFNAAGFDRAYEERELPFPRKIYHPLRLSVRRALPPADAPVVRKIQDFLDAHPFPIERYVEAALTLGDAPGFEEGKGFPQELKGLGALLAEFLKSSRLPRLEEQLIEGYRSEMRALRDQVDGPFLKLREAFWVDELSGPVLMIVPNPLDAPGAAMAFASASGFHVLVLGSPLPGQKVNIQPAIEAYAELLAKQALDGVDLSALQSAIDGLPEVDGFEMPKAADVAAGSLLRAVLAKMDGESDLSRAHRQGFFLASAFLEAMNNLAVAPASSADSADPTDLLDAPEEADWLLNTQVAIPVLKQESVTKQAAEFAKSLK